MSAASKAADAVEGSWFKGIWNKSKEHLAVDGRGKGVVS